MTHTFREARQRVHSPQIRLVYPSRGGLEREVLRRHTMVRLTVVLTAASTRGADDLLDAFQYLVVSTRLERGCVGCSVWMDADATVHYVEDWATETDMRLRVRSERFTSVLAIVESAKEADVHFDFVTTTRGLEYVAEVRNQNP